MSTIFVRPFCCVRLNVLVERHRLEVDVRFFLRNVIRNFILKGFVRRLMGSKVVGTDL